MSLAPNTTPAQRIGFLQNVLVQYEDEAAEQVASLSEVGKGVMAQQGVLSALPVATSPVPPLSVSTNNTMLVTVGGGQMVFCDGYVCDGCQAQGFTVPPASPSAVRVDLLSIAPQAVQVGTQTRNVLVAGVPTPTPEPLLNHGVSYTYTEGTPGSGQPATPAGTVAFATITVPISASGIVAGDISYLLPTMNPQGPIGPGAFTLTAAGVVIPSVNSTVTVPIISGAAFPNGLDCVVSDGTHAIHGSVQSGGGTTTLTVKVDAVLLGAVGNTIASGATVVPSGSAGPQGATGATGPTGAQGSPGHGSTTSTLATTIPAVGSNTTVTCADVTAFPVGSYGLVSDGSHAFAFEITSVAALTLTVTCTAITLGSAGNSVASGATVTFTGVPPSATALPIGSVMRTYDSPPSVSLALPAGGTWLVECVWKMSPGINTYFSATITLAAGVLSAQNSLPAGTVQNNITGGFVAGFIGQGSGGQTITFDLNVIGYVGTNYATLTAIRIG